MYIYLLTNDVFEVIVEVALRLSRNPMKNIVAAQHININLPHKGLGISVIISIPTLMMITINPNFLRCWQS